MWAAAAVAALTAAMLVAAPQASAAKSIVIWSDEAHAPVIGALTANGYRGYTVTVVTKDLTAIRNELATVSAESAPDLVWGDATWSGQLAGQGSIVPISITAKVRSSFRASALAGFQVSSEQYGVPVQVSNLALITNVPLVPKAPTTFAELESIALTLTQSRKTTVPFAVGQGETSDGYALYPLFSGLGGYYFARSASGQLNPERVGLANPAFLRNSDRIDAWNASGLLRSALTPRAAQRAFEKKKSAFWLAGPEDLPALLRLSFVYRITAVPTVVPGITTSPLLRIQGLMMTKYADVHGVASVAGKLAGRFFAGATPQLALAGASGLIPANRSAVALMTEKRLQAIDLAGVNAVPIPNIPQMDAVWGPSGSAWVASTSGAGAPLARPSFVLAQQVVQAALAQ